MERDLHIHGHTGDQAAQRKEEKRIQRASRRRNPAKAKGSKRFLKELPERPQLGRYYSSD